MCIDELFFVISELSPVSLLVSESYTKKALALIFVHQVST